jgi:high-affinity iron transporter
MLFCRKNIVILSVWFCVVALLAGISQAEPDYDGMVDRIEVFFSKSLVDYKAGKQKEAQLNAEAAYFQVFENMEGPIRINISGKKNYLLEEEFSGIRKMVIKGAPYNAIEQKISDLVIDLRKVAGELKGGFVITADPAAGSEEEQAQAMELNQTWKLNLDFIAMKLKGAADATKVGDSARAQEFALAAWYEGFKNTLTEEAIKKYASEMKGIELNYDFIALLGMIRSGESAATVKKGGDDLVAKIGKYLAGAPLVRGAVGKAAPRLVTKDTIPDEDWPKIGTEMMTALDGAMKIFAGGDHTAASRNVQSIYFDIFEGTKLEISIGVLDEDLMLGMEVTFGDIVRGMAAGESESILHGFVADLQGDLNDALKLLESAKDGK